MSITREELANRADLLRGKYSRARNRQQFIVELQQALRSGTISPAEFNEYRQYLNSTDEYARQRSVLALERDGEADAGLERVGLVAEFVSTESKPRLDAHHVECL